MQFTQDCCFSGILAAKLNAANSESCKASPKRFPSLSYAGVSFGQHFCSSRQHHSIGAPPVRIDQKHCMPFLPVVHMAYGPVQQYTGCSRLHGWLQAAQKLSQPKPSLPRCAKRCYMLSASTHLYLRRLICESLLQ